VTVCLELQHYICRGLDAKKATLAYTVDMSAAFNLIRKDLLDLSTIPSKLSNILMNFLSDRFKFVEIQGERSSLRPLRTGVPQGSVLGPKLFSLHIKDLSRVLESDGVNIVAYADDSFVVSTASNEKELIELSEKTLKKHLDWLTDIGMVVNPGKTELVYFNKNKTI